MAQFAHNVLVTDFGVNYQTVGPNPELLAFITANDEWVASMVASHASKDAYWLAVGQVMATMDGILAGYNNFSHCSQASSSAAIGGGSTFVPMPRLDLLLVNLDGDLFDLQTAFPDARTAAKTAGGGLVQPLRHRRRRGNLGTAEAVAEAAVAETALATAAAAEVTDRVLRCSALVKVTADGSDVWFGHDTWDTYATAAPRIFKHVALPVWQATQTLAAHRDSFSSSPGFVASVDDYYVLGGTSRLTVLETSNNVYNASVYAQYLTPQSNMCWVRTMAANLLATDGETWAAAFAQYASGTYNNQWLLLDANHFAATAPAAKAPLPPAAADENDKKHEGPSPQGPASTSNGLLSLNAGLLWVVEEAPGLLHSADMTATLAADGYWASYNVAFFADVRARLAEPSSYADCPRANLFREMQGNVTGLASMQALMGWNDYAHDPLSGGNPDDAIMARGDLLAPRGWAGGGIDSKCSSLRTARAANPTTTTAAATTTTLATATAALAGTVAAEAAEAAVSQAAAAGRGAAAASAEDPLVSFARAGPTHDSLPPFCWANLGPLEEAATPHAGHPACFNYSWAAFAPQAP